MPLTDLQIERILHPDHAHVQIVCGLEALGLSKIGTALTRIAKTGRLPGAPDHGIGVQIAKNSRELRPYVERAKAGGGLAVIVVFQPDSAKQARDVMGWLELQSRVLGGQVRPLLILDAAETEMRDIATRLSNQSQFLQPWGAEMVRVHLRHIEKVELDTKPLRKEILRASGGVPAEVVKLVDAMRDAPDPTVVARNWEAKLTVPHGFLQGALGQALGMLDMAEGGDFETLNQLVRGETGADLIDLGPDLVAMGFALRRDPRTGHFRRSAFGDLVSNRIES